MNGWGADMLTPVCGWVWVGGCVGVDCTDTVKVRMQTQVNLSASAVAASAASGAANRGFWGSIADKSVMWQALRQGGLYRGVGSPLFSIPLVNAIVFAGYEQCKQLLTHNHPEQTLTETQLAICGGVAGFFSCAVVGPVELVRTLQQVHGPARYANTLDCVLKTVASDGIRGLGRGTPMLAGVVCWAFLFSCSVISPSSLARLNVLVFRSYSDGVWPDHVLRVCAVQAWRLPSSATCPPTLLSSTSMKGSSGR